MSVCSCQQRAVSGKRGSAPAARFAVQRGFVPSPLKPVQAKLTVGPAGDEYEQEADRVADRVMRASDRDAVARSAPAQIQRLCVECEREELRRQPEEEEEEELMLQRQAEEEEEEEEEVLQPAPQHDAKRSGPRNAAPDVAAHVHALRGGGQPLPKSARAFFESRFGHDFSRVRIHADAAAAGSADALNARAYTVGHDIAFAAGTYAPESQSGRRLLAHELTHVVQQNGSSASMARVQRRIGDGHDLTATRFSGNTVLEAVYDDERLIRRGSTGTAVRLIQESLVAQGYALPVFGVDGIFGNETDTAVRQFQIDTGAELLDGIVGPETMKLLDMHDPGGTATTGPVPGPPPAVGPARPPATAAVFSEHPQEQFAGYDATTAPDDSLVVPTNGRRQVRVVITPAAAVPAFVSVNNAVATTQPTPDGVAVTGVADGATRIEARQGATVLDTLQVDVKDRLDRSVAFHYVCDSNPPAAGGPNCSNGTPAPDTMRSLLNRVWERQANVRFTGGVRHNIVAPGNMGPYVNDDGFGGDEMGTVTALGAGAHYNVFRVNHVRINHTNTNDALNNTNNTLIGDTPCGDGLGLPHEAGHFLLRQGNAAHARNFLMTPCPGARTRRIGFSIANAVNT